MTTAISPGGLSRCFSCWEPKVAARPRSARGYQEETSESAPLTSSSSTLSTLGATPAIMATHKEADPTGIEALAELRRLFTAECSLGSSAPGFGVSPPVRSGAANGLVHDSVWRQEAPRACKASLRVLHERTGPRWAGQPCAGDDRLLMPSPDQSFQLLASAVEGGCDDDTLPPPPATCS